MALDEIEAMAASLVNPGGLRFTCHNADLSLFRGRCRTLVDAFQIIDPGFQDEAHFVACCAANGIGLAFGARPIDGAHSSRGRCGEADLCFTGIKNDGLRRHLACLHLNYTFLVRIPVGCLQPIAASRQLHVMGGTCQPQQRSRAFSRFLGGRI